MKIPIGFHPIDSQNTVDYLNQLADGSIVYLYSAKQEPESNNWPIMPYISTFIVEIWNNECALIEAYTDGSILAKDLQGSDFVAYAQPSDLFTEI